MGGGGRGEGGGLAEGPGIVCEIRIERELCLLNRRIRSEQDTVET